MRMILVVAFVIIAGMYLWRKKTNVSNQENIVVNQSYPSTEGTAEIRANDEFNKELTAKVLKDYCRHKVILINSGRVNVSLRIAIAIKKEDYP